MTNRILHMSFVALLALAALALISLGLTPTAQATTGCTLFVSTPTDNTTGDANLTLREAVLLANGGTTVDGLNRPLTAGELTHLGAGCTWDANRNLTTGGLGFVDTIYFSSVLNPSPILTLTKALTLTDPGGDVLSGTYNAVTPTLDFGPTIGGPGLVLLQNHLVKGVRVINASVAGIDVQGNNNQLLDVAVWQSGYGIYVRSSYNTIDGAYIGIQDGSATACNATGNVAYGLVLYTGNSITVQYNVIKNSRIVCNGNGTSAPAIYVSGANADHNTIGPNNLIGTNAWGGGANLGNNGDGLLIANGATSTDVLSNTFAYNQDNGVTITNTNYTRLGGNWIRYNTLSGVLVGGTSQSSVIGGPSLNNTLIGNVIGKNGDNGVELQGSEVRYTLLAGNTIGVLPGTGQKDSNTHNGVAVDGARNNFIGDTNALSNTIAGNPNGVLLTNGASQNAVARNVIGLSTVLNGGAGVYLDNGAHDNVIGAAGNLIQHNVYGIVIEGSTTATNTVINNEVRHNTTGFRLVGWTFNNTIGTANAGNTIANNADDGLNLEGGARRNSIGGNLIVDNVGNGLWLGMDTTGNVITGTSFIRNGRSGLSEIKGTNGNNWSQLYFQANSRLPIDKQLNFENEPFYTVNAPPAQIRSRVVANSVITLTGIATSSSLSQSVQVEVYAYSLAGGGLEAFSLGSAPVNNSGVWTLTLNSFAGPYRCLMAVETSTTNLLGQVRTSSEFGFPNCRNLLPAVVR